ncbi:MAG: hypothetical protein AB7O37_19445 [Vicinamibacteria bacterium]
MPLFMLLGVLMAGDPGAEQKEAVRLAEQALSERLGVGAAALSLESTQAVDWPDASLGCPEKGMVYAQVVTPGYEVALAHAGSSYAVHVGAGRAVVCEAPRQSRRQSVETARAAVQAGARARSELARSLGIEASAIRILRVRPASAPLTEGEPECSDLTAGGAAADAPAFRVDLEAQGRRHVYSVAGERVRACASPR